MEGDTTIETSEALENNTSSKRLRNAGGILILGIISILFAGLIGLILGYSTIGLAKKVLAEYDENPKQYKVRSHKTVKVARALGYTGIAFSFLWIAIVYSLAIAFIN